MPKLKVLAGIPARYAATRFPGKPLARLAGRPLVEHVWRRVRGVSAIDCVVIATDDERIVAAAHAFGADVRLTRADHPSGTDRLAEVAAREDCDLVVNVQGDEPLIHPEAITAALEPFERDPTLEAATLKTLVRDPAEADNPNVVKVIADEHGFALSFTRTRPPGPAPYFKHLGLYVYRRDFLLRLTQLPPSPCERAERLEQWRILENGFRLLVVETAHDSIGIDTPEDLARAEALLAGDREPAPSDS